MCSYPKVVEDSQILRYEFQDLLLSVWHNTTVVYTLNGVAIFLKKNLENVFFYLNYFEENWRVKERRIRHFLLTE